MLKTFTVFHVSQIDGLPEPSPIVETPPEARHDAAYAFIEGTKAEIRHEGDLAMYVRDEDVIRLPPRPMFTGDEHYLAAATHELVHWSGAKHRLNRKLDDLLGTEGYRAEELIADLGSAFLCAHLGIEGNLQHALTHQRLARTGYERGNLYRRVKRITRSRLFALTTTRLKHSLPRRIVQRTGKKVASPKRGEVYLVNFDPTVGAEIRKTRPALVIQNNICNRYSAITIVAAITWKFDESLYPTEVLVMPPEGALEVPQSSRSIRFARSTCNAL